MAKEFIFLDYYNNVLKTRDERNYFRLTVCKCMNVKKGTFMQWVYRGDCPAHAELHIQTIINKKSYILPKE